MAKKDRIEFAILQEFESTVDPNTGRVPSEKLYDIQMELQRNPLSRPRYIDPIEWEERGPSNIAGRTRALLIDQADPTGNTVFAGSVSGGIWKTTGALTPTPTWSHVSVQMDNLAIGCLVQDPSNASVMYAGTGEGYFNVDAVKGNGIWKSTNGGQSWNRLSSTANDDFSYTLDLVIGSSGHLFASTRNNGVLRSVNGGQSWTKVLGDGAGASTDRAVDLERMTDGTLFVTMGLFETGGIFRSYDNGNSWTKLTNGLPSVGYHRIEIAVAPSNNNIVYALFQDGQTGECSALYKSTNKGNSWQPMNIPNAYGMSNFTRNQAWYNLAIAVDPTDHNRLIVGGIDLHLSENGGTSWSQISQWAGLAGIPYVHADQHVIVFDANSPAIFFGNDGGVARCPDITAAIPVLEPINTGYNVTQFYGAAIHPVGAVPEIIAGAQDNGTQLFNAPGMNVTTEIAGGDGSICHIDQNDPNIRIATYVFNNYYVSIDGGLNYALKSFNDFGRFANPSVYDNSSQKLYASNWAGSYFRWENPAQSGSATTSVVVPAFGQAIVTAVALSPLVANRAYFGLNNGDVVRVDNIHSGSSKSGTVVLNRSVGSVSCIAVDGNDDDHLLVSYSNYGVESIWETRDGGQTWLDSEGNLPDLPVRWIVFDPENDDRALIATDLGIWRTDDLQGAGTNWYTESNEMSGVRVDQLVFRESDHYLAAASHGRGLFTSQSFVRPQINFGQTEMSLSEQPGDGTFGSCNIDYHIIQVPVSISAPPISTVNVTFSIEPNSSAQPGTDFVLNTPSLSFTPAGPLNKQIQIKILDEAIEESVETVVLKINGPSEFIGDNHTAVIHLFDDDHDPGQQGSATVELGQGSSTSFYYPFGGYYEDGRSQFIFQAGELLAAGLSAGNLHQLSLYITQKNSSIPFNNFNIRLKNISLDQFDPSGSTFLTGSTTVYSGNVLTQAGWNEFSFDQDFYWNGSDHLLVDICFNNQNWSDDDVVRSSGTSFISVQYSGMDGTSGCSIPVAGNVSNQRPDVRFVASQPVQLADEVCQKSTTIIQGEQAHFYRDGKLIASVENLMGQNINCLDISLDRVGDGIDYPAWMEGAGVSEKTFYVDADLEAPYRISLYYHPDELAGWPDPMALSIIKTDGLVSQNAGENYEVIPNADLEIEVLDNGIMVYRGVFESFSGFALTDLEPSTLFIEWLSFEVEKEPELNRIKWVLADRTDDALITLQRVYGDPGFPEDIAWFDTRQGKEFEYTDEEVKAGQTYYRLRFTDGEGRESWSPLRSVFRTGEQGISVNLYPNPVAERLFVDYPADQTVRVVRLIDFQGKTAGRWEFGQENNGKAEIPVAFVTPGIYLVEIRFDSGEKQVKRMIRQ
jgi:photosystem II stability/assembly factor-like uncharacterized protein